MVVRLTMMARGGDKALKMTDRKADVIDHKTEIVDLTRSGLRTPSQTRKNHRII